jgi:hypothetical protein
MPIPISELFELNCDHLSLVDLIKESSCDITDDDESPTLFANSPYYDIDEFVTTLNDKNGSFSLISLNTQSLI